MANALGIDIEEWYHIGGANLPSTLSDDYESRVFRNTERILSTLSLMQTKATFFVLGVVAEKFPDLVKKIDRAGHEVASHGYRYLEVYHHTPDSFREDVKKSLTILEKITGKRVKGYRAPGFSIVQSCLWALDILIGAGIQYDCSIFPVWNPRYGIPSAPRVHFRVRPDLVEFPPSTVRFFGDNYPVAGGTAFRIFPYRWTKNAIERLNSQGVTVNAFLRVWDVDNGQLKLKLPLVSYLSHYLCLEKTQKKFEALLTDFQFVPVGEVIRSQGF